MLVKGLPPDAATWREENARFRQAEGKEVLVSHAWAVIFNRHPEKKITTDPNEIGRFFAGMNKK